MGWDFLSDGTHLNQWLAFGVTSTDNRDVVPNLVTQQPRLRANVAGERSPVGKGSVDYFLIEDLRECRTGPFRRNRSDVAFFGSEEFPAIV